MTLEQGRETGIGADEGPGSKLDQRQEVLAAMSGAGARVGSIQMICRARRLKEMANESK